MTLAISCAIGLHTRYYTNDWQMRKLNWTKGIGVGFFGAALLGFCLSDARAAELNLTLKEFLARVLTNNENIQMKILENEISRKQYEAQKGIFEPTLIGSATYEDRRNALTEEQKRNLFFATVFNERNYRYESAVEMLTPSGAKLRVGYNVNDLNNNLNSANFPRGEYMSTMAVVLTQPLLKDAGYAATMANIRAASINSDISFQEYRKALIEVVARAEAAYWDLALAQQQYAFSTDSVAVAKTVLEDNRGRLSVGKSSELDVLQAEAGLAQRQALENEARQKLYEAANRAMIFYSVSVLGTNDRIRAVDQPAAEPLTSDPLYFRSLADDLNPDALALRRQLLLDGVRIDFAKNQRLPQLDLKGSYGSSDIFGAWHGPQYNLGNHDYPAWMAGLELRLPLGGNIKGRKDLEAARLRKKSTEIAMQTLRVQLDNNIDTAHKTAASYYENVKRYEKVVEFNQNLLKSQLARLEVGKVDSRTVLETERDLFEARLGLVQNLVRFKRAVLDLEQTVGMTLKARNLELSQADLSFRTRALLREGRITGQAYAEFLSGLQREYNLRRETPPPIPGATRPPTP